MRLLISVLVACALAAGGNRAADAVDWCYQDPSCGPGTWGTTVAPLFCNGSRQSPININSSSAQQDATLVDFNFNNYGVQTALTKIKNTGHTVKVTLDNVTVSGGALSTTYQSLQFHLHWGNGSTVPGSEHTVNGKRYPMEMHIVNLKEEYNGNLTLGLGDNEAIAALGFFMEVLDGAATTASTSWDKLASYLGNITNRDEYVNITEKVSLDDLLDGVDRSKYYRYMGSFTTPSCNEIVVWTVFKDSIKIRQETIDLFSNSVRIGNASSILLLNAFRPIQPDQRVTTNQEANTTAANGCSYTLASTQLALAGICAYMGF